MKSRHVKKGGRVDITKGILFTSAVFIACFVTLLVTKPDFIYVQVSPVGEKVISYNKMILVSVVTSIPSSFYFIFSN